MEFKVYNKIIDSTALIFDWRFDDAEETIEEFRNYFLMLEDEFREEISENIYNINGYSEKEKLIKKYIIEIAEWKFNLLNSEPYDEIEEENDHLAPKKIFFELKILFQTMIDIICEECFKNSIDLIKISLESGYTNGTLNLEHYYDKLDFLQKDNEANNQKQFEKIFTSTKAYNFYCYLIENFTHSELAKHSTIYNMMLNDEFIDSTLRPERYKRLLKLSKFNIEIKKSLKSVDAIGKKTKQKYVELKQIFLDI
jgi:hypothetical protein